MVQKESYDFPVKGESRKMWYQFLDDRLPRNHRIRSNLKVVCFPGPQALEITQVYDPLGISRENITAFERDKDNAKTLQGKNLGIKVVDEPVEDYFFRTRDKYNIVHLDYQGNFGRAEAGALHCLYGRPLLKERAFVGTNFLRKREWDGGERYVKAVTLVDTLKTQIDHYRDFLLGRNEALSSLKDAVQEIEAGVRSQKLKEYAGRGLVLALYGNAISGRANVMLTPILRHFAQIMSPHNEALSDIIDRYDNAKKSVDLVDVHTSESYSAFKSIADSAITRMLRRVGWSEVQATSIMCYAMMKELEGFQIDDHVSGSYVSENRSPFYFDYMQVSQDRKLIGERDPFTVYELASGYPAVEIPFPDSLEGKKLFKNVVKMMQRNHGRDITSAPERIYLGSDAKYSIDNIIEEPKLPYISTREELHAALDGMREELPEKGRTAYVTELLDIDKNLGNPQQLIACWTQARKRAEKPLKNNQGDTYISATDDEKARIAAVARIYGDHIASDLFAVDPKSIPGYKAHETMGSYGIKYDSFVAGDAAFLAPERERPLSGLMTTLIREHGSLDNIPESVLAHHKIISI